MASKPEEEEQAATVLWLRPAVTYVIRTLFGDELRSCRSPDYHNIIISPVGFLSNSDRPRPIRYT